MALLNSKVIYTEDLDFLDYHDFYELPSIIYDQKGNQIKEFYKFKRELVEYKDLPESLIKILIFIEDARFYNHYGIDFLGILRAFIQNLISWDIKQGASTIHQQLSKLIFTDREKSIERKLLDVLYALRLEKRYSKKEILEKYLNYVYFGHGIYGIKEACRFYFKKNLNQLTISEASLLIALLRAPNRYSPFLNFSEARKRHLVVFKNLVENKFISQEDSSKMMKTFWQEFENSLNYGQIKQINDLKKKDYAPYFTEYIRKTLETNFFMDILAKSLKKSLLEKNPHLKNEDLNELIKIKLRNYLFTGGFKIYTSLNLEKQILAESLFLKRLKKQNAIFLKQNQKIFEKLKKQEIRNLDLIGLAFLNDKFRFELKNKKKKLLSLLKKEAKNLDIINYSFSSHLDSFLKEQSEFLNSSLLENLIQGSWVTFNPENFFLEVMIGGQDFNQNQFNRAFAKRQPGSVFKIFLYAIAFEYGLEPKSYFLDEAISFKNPYTGEIWSPGNSDNTYRGMISLETAFKYSVNTVAVRLAAHLGLKKILNYLIPLFVLKKKDYKKYNLSLALGTFELTPMQLLEAIASILNNGFPKKLVSIYKIEDRYSNVLYDYYRDGPLEDSFSKKRIFSSQTCHKIKNLMKKVILEGTAARSFHKNPIKNRDLFGKTGTSQNNKDLWFLGGDMQNVSSIWLGFDRGGVSLGEKQFSSNVVIPMWLEFMHEVKKIKID